MLNVAILQGRLTTDPELKHTPSGAAVTSFALAVERSYAAQGKERDTDFINVVAWRNTADFICKYFKKGQMMAIKGTIQVRAFTDKDGKNRKAFEVQIDDAHFCGDAQKPSAPTLQTTPGGYAPDDDDDSEH